MKTSEIADAERGLLVRAPWINLILEGKKKLELRTFSTKIRGRIAMVESGVPEWFVKGYVTIDDCFRCRLDELYSLREAHRVGRENLDRMFAGKQVYCWRVTDPVILDVPISVTKKPGAMIWVRLPSLNPVRI